MSNPPFLLMALVRRASVPRQAAVSLTLRSRVGERPTPSLLRRCGRTPFDSGMKVGGRLINLFFLTGGHGTATVNSLLKQIKTKIASIIHIADTMQDRMHFSEVFFFFFFAT
jgi:hypothetical protein